MSRSTQYIGLTQKAKNWLDDHCEPMESDNSTFGMFGEKVPLGQWKCNNFPGWENWERDIIVREIVQETPWSGGPMIFTCLEADYQNGGRSEMFEWVHNPGVGEEEFDVRTGELWV